MLAGREPVDHRHHRGGSRTETPLGGQRNVVGRMERDAVHVADFHAVRAHTLSPVDLRIHPRCYRVSWERTLQGGSLRRCCAVGRRTRRCRPLN
jgi:hypothetical protein